MRVATALALGVLVFLTFARPAQAAPGLSIAALTTNGRTNPLGIDAQDVSLSWALRADTRGAAQSAYQIRVGTKPGSARTWDSGKVDSDRQVDVRVPPEQRLSSATRYFWQVRVWDERRRPGRWSAPAWFETGLLTASDWGGAAWIGAAADAPDQPRPLLRTTLHLKAPAVRARLYASAQGIYRMSINGQPVGDQFLAPGWTDYRQRLQVQTYDVTGLLRGGTNVVGAALADGWFRGKVGLGWKAAYGEQLALKALLRVTYADGRTEDIATGADWQARPGPYVRADLQDGEGYDARLLPDRWNEAGSDDGGWQPVVVRRDAPARLVPQPDEPVRATEVRTALSGTQVGDGVYLYDMGQNLVGVARVRLRGRAGQTVTLRHGEEVHRRGERKGQLYTENLRTALATDTYTFARDETVIYQPLFTQHGFRYVEISGVEEGLAPADVQAVVLGSDLPVTGELRLSHPMLDQLVRNIRWSARGNFLSIPTDTPARDERLGWTGDLNVFAATANRLYDTRAFLSKWMDDVSDAQRPDGNIPAVVPFTGHQFGETGVGWSDAFITVPYAVWRATGDARILRRHWAAMRRFYDFIYSSATADGTLLEEGRASWFSGDWLSLEGVDRLQEHRLIATAYFAENTRMMAEMAATLGEEARSRAWHDLAARIREAFIRAYRHGDGGLEIGTQTVYAMALGMGLIGDADDRQATGGRFARKLAADNDHLRTGFLGTPWLLPALTRVGRDDLAMRLLLNETYPSWGFEVRMGATTVWERWSGIEPDGALSADGMNSFNHYANGAVGDWMFEQLGGLQLLAPGYRRARMAPLVDHAALDQVQARLRTPYGVLRNDWRRTPQGLMLDVEVPVGTEAEVVLPCADPTAVREGGRTASRAPGVRQARWEHGVLRLVVGSGHYEFRALNRP